MALAAVLASAAALLALPGGAAATTGIEQTLALQVTLTNHGVVFSRTIRPTTDTTLQMRITNKTTKPRSFKLGNRGRRRSGPVSPSSSTTRSSWLARCPGTRSPWEGSTYRGSFLVHSADRFGIPQE